MNLPIQSQPVIRNVSFAKMTASHGVNPSFDWTCVIDCAAALGKPALSSDL